MDQLILHCSSAYLRLVAFAYLPLVLLCNYFCIFKLKTPLSAKAREGMMVQFDPSNYRNFTSCNYGNSLNVKLALPIFPPFCICSVFHSLIRTFQFHIVSHFLHLFGIEFLRSPKHSLLFLLISSFFSSRLFVLWFFLLPFVNFLYLCFLSFSVSMFFPLAVASPLVSIRVADPVMRFGAGAFLTPGYWIPVSSSQSHIFESLGTVFGWKVI